MRNFYLIIIFFLPFCVFSQGGGPVTPTAGDLPNVIPPTPEVSSILKANFLSVSQNTGSANFSIPLHALTTGGFSWPVSLNYNSNGVKVDEIASMVGMGWTLNYGGVVTRTVLDVPDEARDPLDHNLLPHNFATPDYALLDFFDKENADKQSDIFSFSFGGHNGKFILDQNLVPKCLSNYNLKISVINGAFMEGFIIVTDDGTSYHFTHTETSMSRNLVGTNCKTWFNEPMDEIKTSWYLSKIILPSRQKEINFTYISGATTFKTGLNQSLSLNLASESYQCGMSETGPNGPACPVWGTRFSSCSRNQVVVSQFITKIETTGGDKIEFFYDPAGRQDLTGGLRMASFKVTNFQGQVIKNGIFNGSYQTAINATADAESKRLFLESLYIRNGVNSSTDQQVYSFSYLNYSSLPKRLSFAQDIYGFYNGKTSNTCLIPKLSSSDLNYTVFNNGTGYGSVVFGDRAIDTNYSANGLLTTINYPTGGYDAITYRPNYVTNLVNSVEVEQPCGGVSVQKITSYTHLNTVALEREFIYRNFSDNKLSSFLITQIPRFSEVRTVKSDGYFCENQSGGITQIHCDGPSCTKATTVSGSYYPLTPSGAQHVYHRTVIEYVKDANGNNGFTEHKYLYYMDGGLVPQTIMGDEILTAAYNIVPDILTGEYETHVYKRNGSSYQLVKSTIRDYENPNQSFWHNYFVRKNYVAACSNRPGPLNSNTRELQAYDVVEGRIYFNTPVLENVTEKNYGDNGVLLEVVTNMEYANPVYTYPTRITFTGSDGRVVKTEKKYPPDFPALAAMTNRNIISPVIEEKTFRDNVLQTTKTLTYLDWFSNTNLFAPQSVEVKIGASTQTQKIVYHSYDVYGNILEVSKEADKHVSYIWDYKNEYPIAMVQNAADSSTAYTSFEADGKGGWTFAGVPYINSSAPTGKKVYNLSSGNITRTALAAASYYIVSYWSQNATALSITGTQAGYPTSAAPINGWYYFEHKITGQTTITIQGTAVIDELRLYPFGAQMTTYAYDPLIGNTHQCDVNNRVTRYEYDDFGRLMLIRDQYGNVLNKFCYNYAGQTENCTVFYNTVQSSAFTRQNCAAGLVGTQVTYTVPAGTYSSIISQQDANNKALADITQNGQQYANAAGSCIQPTIYATIDYSDWNYDETETTATVWIKFYSDAAHTIPVSVSNLSVNYRRTRIPCSGASTNFNLNINSSGTAVSLGTQIISRDDGHHCYSQSWIVLAGTGYTAN